MVKGLFSAVLWLVYSLGSLLVCLWIAWQISAQINFLYPVWYSLLNIEQTVATTMPRHQYKKEFIATQPQEHQRLFGEMVTSIQNHGRGLESIAFYSPDGEKLGVLLTRNEIIHLQDVARLVDLLAWCALALFILCSMVLAIIILLRLRMPAIKTISMMLLLSVALFVAVVLLAGAKKFFYWLHTVVFPAGHQWFFYYEESLMSTLMKAPDLFAPISVMLLSLAVLLWLAHMLLLRRLALFK